MRKNYIGKNKNIRKKDRKLHKKLMLEILKAQPKNNNKNKNLKILKNSIITWFFLNNLHLNWV